MSNPEMSNPKMSNAIIFKRRKWVLIKELYIIAMLINKLWVHNSVTRNILANIKENNTVSNCWNYEPISLFPLASLSNMHKMLIVIVPITVMAG